jgi:uracil phosphoribosyltransferase
MPAYIRRYNADTVILIVTIMRAGEKMVEDIEKSVRIAFTGLFIGSGGGKEQKLLD